MQGSEKPRDAKIRMKLKYRSCSETTLGYAYPKYIHATVDLSDLESDKIYTRWRLNNRANDIFSDTTACYITIGIMTELGTGNAQAPVGTSENAPNP